MEILQQIFFFIVFICFGAVLPGVFITALLMPRPGKEHGPEALCAISLLSGFVFLIFLWGALRLAGISYSAVSAIHIAAVSVLTFLALWNKERRATCLDILRSIFSAETGALFVLVVALIAYWTHGQIHLTDRDELFRMALAFSAQRSMPAQNPLLWSGLIKYHYALEFFTASASAVTKIPLETIYFRFILPLNGMLVFFGIRGVLAQYKHDFKRYLPHAACLMFFLCHARMLLQFGCRQNTFALGLSALGMSSLWTALASGAWFPMGVCAVAAALITLSKAPFGSLYLFLFWSALAMGARYGLIRRGQAAGAALTGIAGWFSAYTSLSGGGFHGAGSLFRIGSGIEWAHEFLPEYLVNPDRLASASQSLAAVFKLSESVMTVLVTGILPVLGAVFCLYRLSRRGESILRSPAGVMLLSALATLLTGSVLFLFVHYKLSPESDSYWLVFSLWLVAAAAYPLFLEEFFGLVNWRSAAVIGLVPFIELLAWVSWKSGYSARVFNAFGGRPSLAVAAAAFLTLVSALVRFYYRPSRGETLISGIKPAPARVVFISGAALFLFVNYRINSGPHKELFFMATWLLAAAAFPLLLSELKPASLSGKLWLFCSIPFLVALSNAPKQVYWADLYLAEAKGITQEGWTGANLQACSILNSKDGDDKVYLHNILDRPSFTMAAMCRGRMYVSYYLGNAIWEDRRMYSEARAGADRFFNGEIDQPCAWLKERSVGYIYWDNTGSVYKFPELVKKMKFLTEIYEGGNVALYSVGTCGKK